MQDGTYDIDQDAIGDTATMPLRTADGRPALGAAGQQLSITLLGPGSAAFSRARSQLEEKAAARTMARMSNNGAAQVSPEQKLRERAEFLAAVTVSFNGFGRAGLTGYPLFISVYSVPALGHIADQADEFVAKRGNFLPQSAGSSVSTSAK